MSSPYIAVATRGLFVFFVFFHHLRKLSELQQIKCATFWNVYALCECVHAKVYFYMWPCAGCTFVIRLHTTSQISNKAKQFKNAIVRIRVIFRSLKLLHELLKQCERGVFFLSLVSLSAGNWHKMKLRIIPFSLSCFLCFRIPFRVPSVNCCVWV